MVLDSSLKRTQACPQMEARSGQGARRILWLGAIAPFLVTIPKTAAEVESGSFGAIDVARVVIPVSCLLIAWLMRARPYRPGSLAGPDLLLLGFLLWAGASALWSANPLFTFAKAGMLGVQYAILFELGRRYATLRDAMNAVATLIHVLLLTVALTWLFFKPYAYGLAEFESIHRLHGTIPRVDSNPLATIAALGALAVLLRIGPRWTTRSFAHRAVLFGVYLAELIGTRTRTAMIFAAVLLIWVMLRESRRSPWAGIGSLAILAGAVLVVPWQWATITEFLTRGQSARGLTTLTGRTVVWENAIRLWHEQPLTGLGFFTGHRQARVVNGAEYGNFDNTWIELLVDVGLVGTVLLALAVIAGIWRARGDMQSDRQAQTLRLTVLLLGLMTSIINPTLQQTASVAVVFGFTLLLPKFGSVSPGDPRPSDSSECGRTTLRR